MRRLARCSAVSVAILFAAGSAVGDPPSRPALPEGFFPYGAMHMSTISHWQHYLPPIDEYADYLDADLARMKEVGMNTLAVHVDWYDIEPAPGEFNFDRLDRVMDLAKKHDLKVLLWPWPELQPEWVARVHPQSLWLAADGYQPGPACWDDPEVRTAVERFVRTAVARYKDHPAVLAWDLGAEAGIWVASMGPPDQPPSTRLYCYCPHTVARYRQWLENKYSTIDKLNQVWSTYYKDFAEVQPLRTGIFERAQIHWLDWRRFMLESTTGFQKMKIDTARQADPNHPVTSHVGGWGGGYVHMCTDEVGIGREVDVLGTSFFPFWLEYGLGWYDPSIGGIYLDGARSSAPGKTFWIEEMQGGPSIFGLRYRSRFPTPGDIRLWCWQAVAHGATGIFYWNWRPETTGIECGGFGLTHYDGSLTDWAREAGAVGRTLQQHARRFLDARPTPAQVAILYDPRTFIQAHGEGDVGIYANSVRGLYRALFRANIPADFITPDQLLSTDLTAYKALCLPFAYVLSPQEGTRLAQYVENGGHLFAGLFCAFKDQRTFLYPTVPGAGLADLFRCQQMLVNPAGQSTFKITNPGDTLPSLPVGTQLPVYRYQERLDLLPGANVLATFDDGSPAIVAAAHGKGRTLYVATLLSLNYDATADANIQKLFLDFANNAGVRPPIQLTHSPAAAALEARSLEGPAGRTIILINHSNEPATADLTLPSSATATIVTNLLTSQPIPTTPAGPDRKCSIPIPAQNIAVLAVSSP